MMELSKSMTSK